MADVKEMSFMLLIILVAISGTYEWARTDVVLGKELGMGEIGGFESATLLNDVNTFQISTSQFISSSAQLDIVGFVSSLIELFGTTWNIFSKLMFGWVGLVDGIFNSIGMAGLSVIFIGPIAVMQILGAFYFLRDIVNTLRGVG